MDDARNTILLKFAEFLLEQKVTNINLAHALILTQALVFGNRQLPFSIPYATGVSLLMISGRYAFA